MSKFGPMIGAHDVETRLLDVLRTWMHTYLGQAERVNGLVPGVIPRPRSWRKTAGGIASLPDTQLPRIVVQSPGWGENPESNGETVTAFWAVTVGGFWKGRENDETLDRVRIAAVAARSLLMHQAAGELITHLAVADENYDAIPSGRERTLAGFELVCVVRVDEIAQHAGGPLDADPGPTQPPVPPVDYGEHPDVDTTTVTVNPVEDLP